MDPYSLRPRATVIMELPTINTSADVASGSEYLGSPVYRRQHRKQGSTVFVAPPESTETRTSEVSAGFVARGVGALAGAQALAKLASFVLNQMLLRVVSSTDLGQNSQMELWGATVLSLARDAVRFAAVRETLYTKGEDRYNHESEPVHGTKSGTMQEIVNLGYLPIALAVPIVSLLMVFAWNSSIDPLLRAASSIWAVSILLELLSEPCFLLYQLKVNMGMRAKVESIGTILRCIVTLCLVLTSYSTVLAFAVGQLAYSLGLCFGYFVASLSEWHYAGFKLYASRVCDDSDNTKIWFDPRILRLARGMYLQSIFKYLLTESDRILISLMLPLSQQGEYALAANYGSLLARLLLFPVEESLRTLFAKTLKSNKTKSTTPPSSPNHQNSASSSPTETSFTFPATGASTATVTQPLIRLERASSMSRPRSGSVRSRSGSLTVPHSPLVGQKQLETEKVSDTATAKTALSTVLRLYLYLGFGAASVGPYLASYGLRLILSDSWASSQAPIVLAVYICYIPILAWNGSLEAFVQSVASIKDLKNQSKLMVVLALIFMTTAYLFMNLFGLGAVGLVFAQMFNMILRTAWSFGYVEVYFEKYDIQKWWLDAIPSKLALATSASVFVLAQVVGPIGSLAKLGAHIFLGLVLVTVFAYSERSHLLVLLKKIRGGA